MFMNDDFRVHSRLNPLGDMNAFTRCHGMVVIFNLKPKNINLLVALEQMDHHSY